MHRNITTYYKLSHPSRSWDIDQRFDTQQQAYDEILKIQVRQKEKGFTPDIFIIVKVENETISDADGTFIKSITTETRV